jgi:hypothetical protein
MCSVYGYACRRRSVTYFIVILRIVSKFPLGTNALVKLVRSDEHRPVLVQPQEIVRVLTGLWVRVFSVLEG